MTHRILLAVPFLLGISVFLFLLGGAVHNPDVSSNEIIHARKEPLVVWTSYQGQLESNTVSTIMSRFRGTATIIDIVPEGVRISKDDVLVRFDSSDLERELVKLERDVTLARLELNGLEKAELPLELKNIEVELTKADLDYETEFQYLEESIKLAEEGLVSDQEVKKQKLKVNEIAMQRNTLRMQKKLTEEYLHPSRLEQARATLDSAEQEYELTNSQLEESIIRAPMDGVTSYRPISVGGEFRPVRIGDTVFPNQPFMVIPNINDLVIQIEVPENELSRVQEGNKVIVYPVAFPRLKLNGVVRSVSAVAQSSPLHPAWQKFFRATIELAGSGPQLRPGMSVTANIFSYSNEDATVIPRTTVRWENGQPFADVVTGNKIEERLLELGMSNNEFFEVVAGVSPGDGLVVQ
jgi:RND family efflux transporter MFP subunit